MRIAADTPGSSAIDDRSAGFGAGMVLLWLIVLAVPAATGCMYHSPFRHQEWADEERFGVTFSDKLAVLRDLADRAESANPAEREEISRDLARRVSLESNELMRMELVRTLGAYRTESAFNALARATTDTDPRVRRVACERLGDARRPQAVPILSQALETDSSGEVRMAAARSLGQLGDPQATPALARILDDGNPAMQRLAMQSLASVSGQNLGENVAAWKNYTRNFLGEGQEAIAKEPGPAQAPLFGGTY